MIGLIARARRDEAGFALIVSMVLLAALATLSTLVATVGMHADRSSGRGRSWAQALHVAEAGVQDAIARLDVAEGNLSGSFTGTTAEGSYCVTVTQQARNRVVIEATGAAPADPTGNCQPRPAGIGATRKLQVLMSPPVSFDQALFSYTSVETKNNDVIKGDIWANQNVALEDGTRVEGSVVAATGWMRMQQNSIVTGSITTGGFDPSTSRSIHVGSNGLIQGDATAAAAVAASEANCKADHLNWRIRLEGPGRNVDGNVTTCGPVTGPGTVGGTIQAGVYVPAPATKQLPPFTYSPANYSNEVEFTGPTALADFQGYVSANMSSFSGTYYISQEGAVNQNVRVDLTGVTIAGDTTIITNTPIFSNGVSDNTTDAIFTLVSTYQPPTGSTCDINSDSSECSVHIKNNFNVNADGTCNTAVLIYAPYGPVAIKNNQAGCGAIYSQNIQIKNNQTLSWDLRVAQVVGFGTATMTVERWLEVATD